MNNNYQPEHPKKSFFSFLNKDLLEVLSFLNKDLMEVHKEGGGEIIFGANLTFLLEGLIMGLGALGEIL